jgi:hypothetical protein
VDLEVVWVMADARQFPQRVETSACPGIYNDYNAISLKVKSNKFYA